MWLETGSWRGPRPKSGNNRLARERPGLLSNRALKARLYRAALAVLAFGFAVGALLYAALDEVPEAAVGYVVVDGISYPITPAQSKIYQRDLERFGGKSSVLFDEFGRWFAGLWEGPRLGLTIGWLGGIVALALFLFARMLPPD